MCNIHPLRSPANVDAKPIDMDTTIPKVKDETWKMFQETLGVEHSKD